jgi:hypothetical protein
LDKKTKQSVSLNDDIELLEITLKVMDDHNYSVESSFFYQESTYETSTGSVVPLPTYDKPFTFISQHSMFEGYYHAEALNYENYDQDFSEIGTKAYIVEKKGKKYNLAISSNGLMTGTDIPAIEEDYTLVVNIPGHYQYTKKVKLSRTINGNVKGFSTAYIQILHQQEISTETMLSIFMMRNCLPIKQVRRVIN